MTRFALLVALVWWAPCLAAPDAGPGPIADGGATDSGPVDAEVDAAPPPADPDQLTGTHADRALSPTDRLALAVAALDGLPPAGEGEDPDAADRRADLESRVELLRSLVEKSRVAAAAPDLTGLAERRATLDAETHAFDALPAPVAPETIEATDLDGIEARLASLREAAVAFEDARKANEKRIEAVPGELQVQRQRQVADEALADTLANEARALPAGSARTRLVERVLNARLAAEIATVTAAGLESEMRRLRAEATLLSGQSDLARRRARRQERTLELFRRAYESSLKAVGADRSMDLEAARAALAAATTTEAQFMARGQVLLAESLGQRAEATRLGVALERTLVQQQKILAAEKAEFAGLRNLIERDSSGQAAEKLKDAFQRLDRRYDELLQVRRIEGLEALSSLRSRRLGVAGLLFELDDGWPAEIDALDSPEHRSEMRALTERLRGDLLAEQDIIAGTLAAGESLGALLGERDGVLAGLDALVRGRIFWVQDQPPIRLAMVSDLSDEFVHATEWLTASETWTSTPRDAAWRFEVLTGVGLIGSALLLGIWFDLTRIVSRRWPARIAVVARRRREEEAAAEAEAEAEAAERDGTGPPEAPPPPAPTEEDAAPSATEGAATDTVDEATGDSAPPADDGIADPGTRLLVLSFVAAWMWPALCWGLSGLAGVSNLSDALRGPLVAGLEILATILLLGGLSHLLLRSKGVAEVELGLPEDTTATLRLAIGTGLVAAVFTLLPRAITLAPPLSLVVEPRLAYSAFEIVSVLLVLRVLRPSSPVIRDLVGPMDERSSSGRLMGPLWLGLCVFGAGIVVMDLSGYRYGSGWLAQNTMESLAAFGLAFLFWPPLRDRLARAFVGAVSRDPKVGPARALARTQRLMGVLLVLGLVVALIAIWDIDRRALSFLEAVTLYTMGSGDAAVAVTLADLAAVIVAVLVTVFALRSIPRLFELTVFRYLDMDDGARFAIVTIARYAVFFVGVVVCFENLHLDVGRLSWLVAAVGVGLGFGLQEIVANFVSGLILLMERPIRIGDWVTIGTIEGTVERINIRATTVMTLDRQEIIVPNKDFITREVINWTLGDRMVRLTVGVGVAYGTDVERVRTLLLGVAAAHPAVLDAPAPTAILAAHGESSLDFELRVHHMDPPRRVPLLGELNKAINTAIVDAGIEIPFPQRDLHLRTGWPPESGD